MSIKHETVPDHTIQTNVRGSVDIAPIILNLGITC